MTRLSPSRAAALALMIPLLTIAGAWLTAASLVHAKQSATPATASAALTGATPPPLPVSIAPCPAGCPVRIEGAHSTADYLFDTVTIRNVGDKPMTSVVIETNFFANESEGTGRFLFTAARVPVDLKPRATLTLTVEQGPFRREAWALPERPCDLAAALWNGRTDAPCDMPTPPPPGASGRERWPSQFARVLEFKEKWPHATVDLLVQKAELADGTTWGKTGLLLVLSESEKEAPAQYSEFCFGEGMPAERGKANNGFSMRARNGHWVTCRNGSWVATPQ
jgi:hypothetical protein